MDVLDIEETVKELLSSNRKAARFLANLRGSEPQSQLQHLVLKEGKAPVEVRTSSETRRLVLSGDCPSEPQPVEARSSEVGDSSSEPPPPPRFRILIKRKAPEEVRTSDLGGSPSEPRPQPRCVILNKGKAPAAEIEASELGGITSDPQPRCQVLNKGKAPAAEIQASELGGSLSDPQPRCQVLNKGMAPAAEIQASELGVSLSDPQPRCKVLNKGKAPVEVRTSDLGGGSSESQQQPRPPTIVVDRIPRGRDWVEDSLLPGWRAKRCMAFLKEKASKVEPRASEPQPQLPATTIAQMEN